MIDSGLQTQIETILEKYRGFTPLEIAKELDVKIYFVEFNEPDFAGAINKDSEGNINIYVNKNDSEERKKFTIAHELGHFFLHPENLQNGIISYRSGASYAEYSGPQKKLEEQANHFAAEMLMPKNLFIKYYEANSDKKTEKLEDDMSKLFGVSGKAIKIRRSYLDLI